jgi:hypothetical protein
MNKKERILRKLWHRIEVIWIILIFIVLFLAASLKSEADLIYNLRAELEDKYIYIDNEKHYYDIFFISTPSYATVTFDNYAADLGSNNEDYDYNDPYLYLLPNFQQSIYNYIYEDDDGNEDVEEGLFFYLADITFTNNMIALVTSYDPEVKGTVDFNITSDNQLMIIPEPAAISLLFTAGILLIVLRKNKRLV